MCGIAGALDPRADRSGESLDRLASAMADALRHRGPDDGGSWVDADAGLAFGHRRLSILDLSSAGHQPMVSASGRWVVTYNGELYNFREIRQALEEAGHRFRGSGDTEVLVAGLDRWGIARTLEAANGMFAMAIWDRETRTLHLARDRLGEKPLYYGWAGRALVFASELKAVRCHPDFAPKLNRAVLGAYLRHNCVPSPHSIYEGIWQLPPGHHLAVTSEQVTSRSLSSEPYWSMAATVAQHRPEHSSGDVLGDVDRLLRDAVTLRMESDVPLGVFLSGGIDSSLVAAVMQASTCDKIKTFTVGFDDPSYDESASAAAVARHLGTDHHELRLEAAQVMAVIPDLPRVYDEPFADSSQIPTLLLSRFTRDHVTVALTGDGGDEVFGGYNRHAWVERIWQRSARVPLGVRRAAGRSLSALPPGVVDACFSGAARALPPRWRVRNPAIKLAKLASVVGAASPEEMYRTLVSHWQDPDPLVLGEVPPVTTVLDDPQAIPDLPSLLERMLYLDTVSYLPDDILTKVDRASMSVGLETRVPLLDHRLVELAWRLPPDVKIRAGTGKWALRELLHRYVPAALVDRPKMGFGLPLGSWLRGPLRPWAEDLLSTLDTAAILDPAPIRSLWAAHLAGRVEASAPLWDVLAFQSWVPGGLGAHRT